MNPTDTENSPHRPRRVSQIIAISFCALGVGALTGSFWWRQKSADPVNTVVPVSASIVPLPSTSAVVTEPTTPDPFVGIPSITVPVSPNLWIVADRSRSEEDRLKPLVNGTVVLIKEPQDIALIRRILRDPKEGDTIRNEAANLLNRSEVASLADDLIAILAHPAEQARFRSFAAQHIGVLWLQTGAKTETNAYKALLAALDDRHVEVRREALLPLARGHDPLIPALVHRLLTDPKDSNQHDLCCRIVADLGLTDELPVVRSLLSSPDEVIRIAALGAVAKMKDLVSHDVVSLAAKDGNARIAAAGQRALATLSEGKP